MLKAQASIDFVITFNNSGIFCMFYICLVRYLVKKVVNTYMFAVY